MPIKPVDTSPQSNKVKVSPDWIPEVRVPEIPEETKKMNPSGWEKWRVELERDIDKQHRAIVDQLKVLKLNS